MGCQVNSNALKKPRIMALAGLLICIVAGLLAGISATPLAAGSTVRDAINIALDAGHGGADSGAHGPTGLIEKDITLELARKMALRLETEYRVTLTRSDDYQLPLRQRAAIANQAKADLFISLHTGASYHHSARGLTIYYHAPIDTAGSTDAVQQANQTALKRWSHIQSRHSAASQRLAAALQNALTGLGDAYACRILPAPLPLLEGADMPAVLVEVGPITNPAAEGNILSDQGLNLLVEAIGKGISTYLDQ